MENKQNKTITIVICAIALAIICVILYLSKDKKKKVLKEYNSTGQLIGTNEYIVKNGDTIMHGKYVNYNERGIKISEGQFENNEPNGKNTFYYDDGKLESIHFRKNSKITEESIYYYENGNIRKVIMYDPLGLEAFIARYDEQGNLKSYDGYPQLETYQYKYANKARFNITEDQKLKVGDTLKYSYIVANIPKTKRSFKIENVGIDNAKVKRITKKIEPCQIDVKEVLTKKGKNTIRSIVKYEFNDKVTPVFTDTLSFNINVD